MKVLIITNAFPNSAEQTRGIFTYQIAKALQEKCEVEVIAPLPWVPPLPDNVAIARYSHVNVPLKEIIGDITVHHPRYLVIPKILGFMHAAFMYFPLLKLVRKLVQRDIIDLINAHWVFPDGVAATWVGTKLCKPVVLTALGCDINLYTTMALRRFQIIKALKRADYITAVSNGIKDKIVSLNILPRKIRVVPNGIDPDLFSINNKRDARMKLGIPVDLPIILTVGNQDEAKGTKFLIEALKIMRERIAVLPLLILIGDGQLGTPLVSLAQRLGMTENVLFLGRKPHREIPLWMNAADAFCLPSLREGHPNAVIEALACGIPVVASDVGGIPEIINRRNGRIAKAGDPVSLCDQLLFCLKASWNRVSIRETVENFTWQDCAEKYMSCYISAIERKGQFS